ncbi:MAG TPA: RdgB/HAM1 family non-canonical purine NTP pyrophosphatase [Anaerolineaceae bacterium]|nr:RdgB/HAM1 family non-canonical purine NTP pyrophosphatase [Anaerolineaceae bacterium]
MSKILFASNNPGKLREAKAILEPYGFVIISPESLGIDLEVAETGLTYLENATLKAKAFYFAANIPCIADDSGLEVEALQGAPGVFSHRFAGSVTKTDAERCQYLLEKLRPFSRPWKAAFHCYAVFYDGVETKHSHGICEGEIVEEAKGSQGFGYDPIFRLEGYPLTMAEAGEDLKNRVSHRADALKKLIPFLNAYFHLQPCL